MPAPLIHLGTRVLCAHGGQAAPVAPNPRVKVLGQPVITVAMPFSYSIAGCALPPPPTANGPCVGGQFTAVAARVKVEGSPVLLFEGPGVCAPTGMPLIPAGPQTKVLGT
jgi:hypothetical protein